MKGLIHPAGFHYFSLCESQGWFRGEPDPGWVIMVADNDTAKVARLAEVLRAGFEQEGVGIEAFGCYLRCRVDHGPELLAAELWGLRHGFHPGYFQTEFVHAGSMAARPANFVILTAYATTGETWTPARNQLADDALGHRIRQSGAWFCRVTGQTPDGTHAEPGWAVELDVGRARELGREFLQDAIFVVTGDELRVVGCADARNAPLESFARRLRLRSGQA